MSPPRVRSRSTVRFKATFIAARSYSATQRKLWAASSPKTSSCADGWSARSGACALRSRRSPISKATLSIKVSHIEQGAYFEGNSRRTDNPLEEVKASSAGSPRPAHERSDFDSKPHDEASAPRAAES